MGLLGAILLLSSPAHGATLLTPVQENDLNRAGKLLDQGNDTAAREILDRLRADAENSPGFHILDGRSIVAEAPSRARASALVALRLDSLNKDALDLLGRAYATQRSARLDQAAEATMLRLEIEDYEHLLGITPEWPELLYRCASQRIALHRLEPALKEELERAVIQLGDLLTLIKADAPLAERSSAHHQLGRALKHQADQLLTEGHPAEAEKKFAEAIEEFGRSMDLDPNRVDSLGEIILMERARDNHSGSLESLRSRAEKIEKPGALVKAHEMLGALYAELGDTDAAIAELTKAITLNEKSPGGHLTLFRIYLGTGETEKAEAAMRRGLQSIPNFLEGHLYLGQFLMQRSRPEEAITAFETALAVPSDDAIVIAMKPSPDLARHRFYYRAASTLAWLYLDTKGDPLKARSAVHLAQKYSKADPHLLDTSGWIYYKLGEYEKSVETLRKAIADSGGFPAAHYHLAVSYEALGRDEEALGELEKALSEQEDFSDKEAARELQRRLRQ